MLSYTPVNTYSAAIGPDLAAQMAEWQQAYGLSDKLVLYGRGDHGGGPRQDDMTALAALRATPGAPRIVHTVPLDFFRDVLQARYNPPVYRVSWAAAPPDRTPLRPGASSVAAWPRACC